MSGELFKPGRVAVAAALAATMALGARAAVSAASFSDTPADAWYVQEGWIDHMEETGLITGYKDPATQQPTGEFGPEDEITRGQVATILYRYANPGSTDTIDPGSYAANDGTFTDLPGKYYYNAAVLWCAQSGIVTGYKDPATQEPTGEFGPEDPVTRDQMATMVHRFAAHMGADASVPSSAGFDAMPDRADVMPFAAEPMAWCFSRGILTGDKATGLLNPLGRATRAQAAKIVTVTTRDVIEGAQTGPNPASDFVYGVEDGEVEIGGYRGSGTRVVVPPTIEGKPVTFAHFFGSEGVPMSYDFSLCSDLNEISFEGVTVADLQIGKLDSLEAFSATASSFKSHLNLAECANLKYFAMDYGVSFGSYDLPQDNLETILIQSNGSFSFTEMPKLKTLLLRGGVVSLGKAPELTKLELYSVDASDLDLSFAPKLESVAIQSCSKLTSLNVSGNPELKSLHCENNALTSLDISKNTKLESLRCHNNAISDTSALTAWLEAHPGGGQVLPQR